MGKRINWTALANAEPEFIDALLVKERIERKAEHVEIMTQRAVKIAVYVHAIDQSVAPTVTMSQQKRRPIMTRKAKQTKIEIPAPTAEEILAKAVVARGIVAFEYRDGGEKENTTAWWCRAASSRKMVSGTA